MSRAKSVLGIAVLCALALSAFGASSASAVGTTAHTCVKDSGGSLFGPHCLATSSGNTEKFKHVEIPTDKTTTITGNNTNTAPETKGSRASILKGALAGVETAITCTEAGGSGWVENKTSEGEMYILAEGKIEYKGCTVTAPAGKGCNVAGGAVTTNQIVGTSLGQGMAIKISPKEEGGKFAEITIKECSIAALNNTFPVTGFLKANTENGATLTSTHAEITGQNTLKFGGVKAGLDGALTIEGHEAGEETHPLSSTTT
ncbi:MAG TPA: hypothetical protein VFJ57_03215 [Solirubrobacterales bacterium]|nr:hypothetical protein [Solirubrobacterales bacterium]